MPAGRLALIVELAALTLPDFPFPVKAKVSAHTPKPLVFQLGTVVEPVERKG